MRASAQWLGQMRRPMDAWPCQNIAFLSMTAKNSANELKVYGGPTQVIKQEWTVTTKSNLSQIRREYRECSKNSFNWLLDGKAKRFWMHRKKIKTTEIFAFVRKFGKRNRTWKKTLTTAKNFPSVTALQESLDLDIGVITIPRICEKFGGGIEIAKLVLGRCQVN